MTERRPTSRWIRTRAVWLLAIALAPALAIPLLPADASAQTEEEELARKAEWQDRYRTIRNNAVRMRDNAIKLRRAYKLSQHSNYPRGGARLRFKQQVEETENKAEEFERDLASFVDEARENQIPPGWIYEVDDEPVDPGTPAAFDDDEETHEARVPEGRNPIYYGDSAEDEDRDDDYELDDEDDD